MGMNADDDAVQLVVVKAGSATGFAPLPAGKLSIGLSPRKVRDPSVDSKADSPPKYRIKRPLQLAVADDVDAKEKEVDKKIASKVGPKF